MKATLLIFVAVALVGCVSPDLDNPETLKRILGEAQVGAGVKTGWRKIAHVNGKVSSLSHFKDGELDSSAAAFSITRDADSLSNNRVANNPSLTKS